MCVCVCVDGCVGGVEKGGDLIFYRKQAIDFTAVVW